VKGPGLPDAAIRTLPPLAGVVNVAGYQGVFAPVDRYPSDDARRVLEVNILGLMHVLSGAARSMVEHGGGGAFVLTSVLFEDGSSWEESKDNASCKYVWYHSHKKNLVKPVRLPFRE